MIPLPEPHILASESDDGLHHYTGDQMHAYAAASTSALQAEVEALRKDAERYRWLRDVSVPPHNFYLSVPVEFYEVKYCACDVDAEIDAAIRAGAGGES